VTGGFTRTVALVSVAGALAGCELTEVVIADAEDVVVAEFVLVAGSLEQVGILHRTRGTDASGAPVDDAVVEVHGADGARLRYHLAEAERCLQRWRDDALERTACYESDLSLFGPFVRPGETYTLRITLPDGRTLTGATTMPASFELLRPAALRAGSCALPPDTTLEISWTRSPSAWVYVAETELGGIRPALAARGVELEEDPLHLLGLSISNADTTITFPTEFGVFDRFDPDLTEALAAIHGGLPPLVAAEIVIGAADRNYVNWERGGIFNPSGFVRVPSVFGDGTGVFGSVVRQAFRLVTADAPDLPRC
jgi:hypothetical protein